MKQLEGRVAVVTGAARGIGLAIARELKARGCRLALVDRSDDIFQVAESLGAHAYQVDVSDAAAMLSLPARVLEHHDAVHLLVNNAGVSVAGPFLETPLEDLEWIMGINFWGMVYGCKAFVPVLLQQPEGHVLNVCSSFGLLGMANKSAYCATKFALRGFSEALRAELYGTAVGLTVLYPGPVDTGIVHAGRVRSEAQREAEARFLASRAVPPERVARRAVEGIRRNAARVLVSVDYRAIDWMVRLAPSATQDLTARISRRMPF